MPIDSYSALQSAVATWLDDDTLTAWIPDYISLAEAEFSRVLRTPEMETVATLSTVAGMQTVNQPADVREIVSLTLATDYNQKLDSSSLAVLLDTYNDQVSSRPASYALASGKIHFGPTPDAVYSITAHYRTTIAALSDSNTSNWLLASHPDLYLFGTLLQAEFFGWNDGRLPMIKGRVDELLAQINAEGRRKAQGGNMRLKHGVRGG